MATQTIKAPSPHGAYSLDTNPNFDFKRKGVTWFDGNLTAGAAVQVNDSPTSEWWHILRFNHQNTNAYYTDLAIPFNNNSIYYKINRGGAIVNNQWCRLLDAWNFNNYTPTLTGTGASGTWNINITGNAATATKLSNTPNNTATFLRGDNTWTNVLTGGLNLQGDLSLYTASADSPDIVWWYGNQSQEQARIWMGSGSTSKWAPNYRCYAPDGTALYGGCLVLGDGTGASGTWGINITGGSRYVYDRTNTGTVTYLNYGAAGLVASSIAWLACWNGYELRAISKSEVFNAVRDNGGDGRWAQLAAHNNLTASGNEFTFASSGFSGQIWINYRTAGGTNGNITQYNFCNGQGGLLASITSGTFNGNISGNANSANYTSNLLGVNTSNSPYGYTEGNIIRAVWNVQGDSRWYFRAGSYQCRVDYANGANSANSANSANYLAIDNTANRASCLQFMQRSDGVDSPSQTWYQIIKMNHGTGDSYYKRTLAFEFWSYNMWTTYAEGNGTNHAWKRVWVEGNSVTSAVWNDYAECRQSHCEEFGYVVYELGDDTVDKTTERLQHFAGITSDTWGFSQGETEKAKTPIAVAGRVLAYPYRPREEYKPGDCLCAAPGGTVDIMTREEVLLYPDRIIGTVSCVPEYEEWGGGEYDYRKPIRVNGRIWVKVR